MQQINFNSESDLFQGVINELSGMNDRDYVLFLSVSNELAPLYKNLSFNFEFPFPQHIFMFDENWEESPTHSQSRENLLRTCGFIGRSQWEKSNFYSVFGSNLTDPAKAAGAYETKLLELLPSYSKKTVLITGMDADGGFGGMHSQSEAVESDKFYISFQHEDKLVLSATAICTLDYISKSIVVLNTAEKCGAFQRIYELENDVRDFPALLFKNIPEVTALCLSA